MKRIIFLLVWVLSISMAAGEDHPLNIGYNDLFSSQQWALKNTGQSILHEIDDINSFAVKGLVGQDIGLGALVGKLDGLFKREVVVAVLDSGSSLEHVDLKGSIFKNSIECDAAGNIKHKPKEDLDGNGYKGDCQGWDFTAKPPGSNRPLDNQGHGTHIAGIISAQIGNGIGIAGVSNKIKILPIKVLKPKEQIRKVAGLAERITKGLHYAIKMKVDVINFSLGWPKAMDTKRMRDAVQEAIDNGIIVVAAAGNNNSNRPIYPCSYNGVICVGAVTNDGHFASFSNYGGMVDLLAPGEKILSTIPKKQTPTSFAVKGYDFKNGTSQAAPYVSAAAAVLRGLYPSFSNNEIFAALIHSAAKVIPGADKKFSLTGLINLEKAINNDAPAILYPNLKAQHIIDVNIEQQSFSFEVPLTALNKDINNITAEVIFADENIERIHGQAKIALIKKGETQNLKIQGILHSLEKNAEASFTLTLKYNGEVKVYRKEFVFARRMAGDAKVIKIKVDKEKIKEKLLQNVRGKLIPLIRSVKDKYKVYRRPEYYLVTRGKVANKLSLLSTASGNLLQKSIQLPHVTKILDVYKYDLNYDGRPDYFIRSLANDTNAEEGKQKHILYSYLDAQLQPLLGENSHFKYFPEVVIMQPEKISFLPSSTEFGEVAVPYFMAHGGIPVVDRNLDPWIEEDLTKKGHLYFYQLNTLKNIVEARLFDNYKFIKKLRNDLKLKWYHDVNIIRIFEQSASMLKNGLAKVHVAVGDGFAKKAFEINITKNFNFTLRPIITEINIEGYFAVPLTHLGKRTPEYYHNLLLTTFQSVHMAHFVLLQENNSPVIDANFTYLHARKKDHLLGVMSAFSKADTQFTFLQSKGSIILNIKKSNKISTYIQKIHRTSFIPGIVFLETFYPVVSGKGASMAPGFYVDATQLHAGHIYLLKATENGLSSPIRNNVFIPENCVSLNPVRFDETEAYALICQQKNGIVELNYLPME